jgi:addiction module HigA family antidote
MAIGRTRPLAGPRGLSSHTLSIALRLRASRISRIVRGQRAITPETALRLARYFGGPAAICLAPASRHDLSRAETELAAKITPAAA